jgi:hypothetical protein
MIDSVVKEVLLKDVKGMHWLIFIAFYSRPRDLNKYNKAYVARLNFPKNDKRS